MTVAVAVSERIVRIMLPTILVDACLDELV